MESTDAPVLKDCKVQQAPAVPMDRKGRRGSTFGLVELHLVVDGAVARVLRTSVLNYLSGGLSSAWHIHTILPLAGGLHDFRIEARILAASGPSLRTPRRVACRWL